MRLGEKAVAHKKTPAGALRGPVRQAADPTRAPWRRPSQIRVRPPVHSGARFGEAAWPASSRRAPSTAGGPRLQQAGTVYSRRAPCTAGGPRLQQVGPSTAGGPHLLQAGPGYSRRAPSTAGGPRLQQAGPGYSRRAPSTAASPGYSRRAAGPRLQQAGRRAPSTAGGHRLQQAVPGYSRWAPATAYGHRLQQSGPVYSRRAPSTAGGHRVQQAGTVYSRRAPATAGGPPGPIYSRAVGPIYSRAARDSRPVRPRAPIADPARRSEPSTAERAASTAGAGPRLQRASERVPSCNSRRAPFTTGLDSQDAYWFLCPFFAPRPMHDRKIERSEKLSAALSAALVGNKFSINPSKISFHMKKIGHRCPNLHTIQTFLTLKQSLFSKSGSTFSSSEPVAAR